MAIYTKTGDKGRTRINGGEWVEKDDPRIEANGTLDELNSLLGVVRTFLTQEEEWNEWILQIQRELMSIMSHVATPSTRREKNPNLLDATLVSTLESRIDLLAQELGAEKRYFVLPSGGGGAAYLQLARAVTRRAERRLWTLHKLDPLPEGILIVMNRLSDFLFTMARVASVREGRKEEKWKHFQYKQKRNQ